MEPQQSLIFIIHTSIDGLPSARSRALTFSGVTCSEASDIDLRFDYSIRSAVHNNEVRFDSKYINSTTHQREMQRSIRVVFSEENTRNSKEMEVNMNERKTDAR